MFYLCLISTECVEGWFGEGCNHKCTGHCKDNIICNHVTGNCERGCSLGWTGYRCEKGSGFVYIILIKHLLKHKCGATLYFLTSFISTM